MCKEISRSRSPFNRSYPVNNIHLPHLVSTRHYPEKNHSIRCVDQDQLDSIFSHLTLLSMSTPRKVPSNPNPRYSLNKQYYNKSNKNFNKSNNTSNKTNNTSNKTNNTSNNTSNTTNNTSNNTTNNMSNNITNNTSNNKCNHRSNNKFNNKSNNISNGRGRSEPELILTDEVEQYMNYRLIDNEISIGDNEAESLGFWPLSSLFRERCYDSVHAGKFSSKESVSDVDMDELTASISSHTSSTSPKSSSSFSSPISIETLNDQMTLSKTPPYHSQNEQISSNNTMLDKRERTEIRNNFRSFQAQDWHKKETRYNVELDKIEEIEEHDQMKNGHDPWNPWNPMNRAIQDDILRSSTERLDLEFGKVKYRCDFDYQTNTNVVNFNYVKDLDWDKQKQKRAGVIVYCIHNNRLVFGLGVDTEYNEITDFGGHVESGDSNPIETGLREFKEESLGIYGNITKDDVSECVVLHTNRMLIMFLPLEFNHDTIMTDFKQRLDGVTASEVNELIWIDSNLFKKLIIDDHMVGGLEGGGLEGGGLESGGLEGGGLESGVIAELDPLNINQIGNKKIYGRVKNFLKNAFEQHGDFTTNL